MVSWVVAVTFTPYLGVMLLPNYKKHDADHDIYQTRAFRIFRSLVRGCLRFRWLVILATFGALGVIHRWFSRSRVKSSSFLDLTAPKFSSTSTCRRALRFKQLKLSCDDWRQSSKTFPSSTATPVSLGQVLRGFFISLNPEQPDGSFGKVVAIANDSHDRDIAINKIRKVISEGAFPEARVRVDRLLFGPASAWPVGIRVIGPDPQKLREIAGRVREIMVAHPHTDNVNLAWNERVPVYRLNVDVDRLRAIGLTPIDVARQSQFSFDGVPVTELRQDIRTVELRARGLSSVKQIEALQGLEIKTQDGRTIPVAQLGELQVDFEEPVVQRYNRELMLAVQSDVIGAESPDVAAQVWQDLTELRTELPAGYQLTQAGTVENSEKANASINKLGPVMLGLMLISIMLQVRTFNGAFYHTGDCSTGVDWCRGCLANFQSTIWIRCFARPDRISRDSNA